MGTTYSWYYVKNQGQTVETIRAGLGKLAGTSTAPAGNSLARMMARELEKNRDSLSPEILEQAAAMLQKILHDPEAGGVTGFRGIGPNAAPYAAYRPGAAFFPVFAEELCEGHIASSRDCERIYKIFLSSVLAFSVFDSDAAFVSFFDGKERGDFARAPEGYEEYDEEVYSCDFPDFLLTLCPPEKREKVREIWEKPDWVFADDKVAGIAELLGLPMLFAEDPERGSGLEGWEIVE